jgi:metal-responsive CopG/Arc/MetJ family transcriptional regulator
MKRRSNTNFTQIHVSLPLHVLKNFDTKLNYNQSRSAKIALLMKEYASDDQDSLLLYTTEEIVEHLQYKFHVDSPEHALISSLLKILTK